MPYLGIRPEMELRARQSAGYEAFGYWAFLAEEGAAKIIDDNVKPHPILLQSLTHFFSARILSLHRISKRSDILQRAIGTNRRFEEEPA